MKLTRSLFQLLFLSGFLHAQGDPAAPPVVAVSPPPGPVKLTLSVRDADLKDILRAATEGTEINLLFEPGLDTRVKGLDLKAVTLVELLETVLPGLGLAYVKTGRTLFIHKGDGGLRFYQVDQLAMRRQGSKQFQVNASGQTIQSPSGGSGGGASGGSSGGSGGQGGQGSQGGNSSAYVSTLNSGNASDPWQELEMGLSTLVFGEPIEMKGGLGAATVGQSHGPSGPTSKGASKDGRSLIIHPDSGLVVVGADPGIQKRVEAYLGHLKSRNQRQVLLEARIVEVTLGKDSQVGVDWNAMLTDNVAGGPAGGTSLGTSFTPGDTLNTNLASGNGIFKILAQNARITAGLSALARDGRLQVLSSPRITAMNNQKAILRVVREEAFFLQSSNTTTTVTGSSTTTQITPMVVPVGIVLDIQPQIGSDGMITLAVNPSVSEIVTVRSLTVSGSGGGASATLPVVDRRDLDTVVRMRSGETLVLAGIIKTKESYDDRGVPWFQKLPWIGNLFSKRERSHVHTELAIFITPTLVDDASQVQTNTKDAEVRLEKAGADLGK